MGSICASFYALCAVGCMLFDRCRTGRGQASELNLQRCGFFAHQQLWSWGFKHLAAVDRYLHLPTERYRGAYPSPFVHTFRTRDGHWVQMVCMLPQATGPKNMLSCLGTTWPVVKGSVSALFGRTLFDWKNSHKWTRLYPIFEAISSPIEKAVSKLDWDDLHALF